MKKSFIKLVIIPFLFLSSCNSSAGKKTNHFKEYTFTATATTKQLQEIKDGLSKSILSVSSIKSKQENYQKSNLSETNVTTEVVQKIFKDTSSLLNQNNFILEANWASKTKTSSQGINLEEETSTKTIEWDGGSGYLMVVNETTKKQKTEKTTSIRQITGSTKEYKEERLKNLVALPSNLTCYVNTDGSYTFIASNVSRNVTAIDWGKSTKEYITSSKDQIVYKVSKDYRLTSYYRYQENKTNRDQETGEWYGSEKLIRYSYSESKYEYSNKFEKKIDDLNKSVVDQRFLLSISISKHTARVANSGADYYTFPDGENNAQKTVLNTYDNPDFSSGAATYRVSSSVPRNYAERYEMSVTYLQGANKETTNYQVDFGSLISNYDSNQHIDFVRTDYGLYVVNKSSLYYPYVTFSLTFDGNSIAVSNFNINIS